MEVINIPPDSDLKVKFSEVGVRRFYKYYPLGLKILGNSHMQLFSCLEVLIGVTGIYNYERL